MKLLDIVIHKVADPIDEEDVGFIKGLLVAFGLVLLLGGATLLH